MNKMLPRIFIGIALCLVGYFLNSILSTKEVIPNSHARVIVKNDSGKKIQTVVLTHNYGTLQASPLNDKDEVRFIFEIHGENTYDIAVTFDDGLMIKSEGQYFEYGYRSTETIKSNEIITENGWGRFTSPRKTPNSQAARGISFSIE